MKFRNSIPKFTTGMIVRSLYLKAAELLGKYPMIAILGPRQSGKTTLAKMLRPGYQYLNLEDFNYRSFAESDPKGFLAKYRDGVIIDEVQNAPNLFSYLQLVTDERKSNGEYILTGSQNYLMMEKISQSLAGRIAIMNLLPFSSEELKQTNFKINEWRDYAISGSYPRRMMQNIDPADFYSDYMKTYIERDVRMIKNILNLDLFQKFIRLLAARAGQLFNQSSLGNELGLDNKTITSWMSVLETSFIAFRLQPYFKNFNKRLVKSPKVYFYDTGLLSYLLNVRNKEQLDNHFAKGSIFENLVITELMKNNMNQLKHQQFYFWRDHSQNEVDLIVEDGISIHACEIKSTETINPELFKSLSFFKTLVKDANVNIICGVKESQFLGENRFLSFYELEKLYER